ncbi:DegQ family serine endoprotease [Luteibacter jiangsuensis]|uniref:Probable periplasmic serine endoprotease DegP-like n=1 Tax=Luteibacter jiangsuensis TaxID=637577 RepID=A0ABX0PYZ3_9GAMM|nr:DegQ family serine endoprotease [Luteibacter jiangsuensis]NID03589.1 DegQ family serine endoprotease [Luteibacter jiangsuensis]
MAFWHVRALLGGALVVASAGAQAQTLPDFTGVVEKNAPAVVHVEAKTTGTARKSRGGPGDMPDDQEELLRRFFGMPGMPMQPRDRTSLGSGFIISGDGYILTNDHVVDDADEVKIRLQDRRTFTAKVVGKDPQYDIALLKIDGKSLPTVTIGDSRTVKRGQWALAIGSPFGLDATVTHGIISAVGRNLGSGDQPYTSFIQTDVPINRGNSGGPLFNLQGQVIGINSQIYSTSGGYQGLSFSIPIDVAMNVVQQIKDKGYVSRGMLGVTVQPVDQFVKNLDLPDANGALVAQVTPGSGADKAGLKQGDVILSFNGTPITSSPDLPPLVGLTKPGSIAKVEILRDHKKQTVDVKVGEMPRDKSGQSLASDTDGASGSAAALGMSVEDIDASTRSELGLKAGEGVVVSQVSGSAAAGAGLRPGDVILMVNQKRVGSSAAFRAAVKGLKPGDTAMLLVRRDDSTRFVGVTVPSDR